MAHCGAKTRSGQPCRNRAMPNGRCRMHGGKNTGAPKSNQNAKTHGLYASALTDEEKRLWNQIELGNVDDELRMAKIRLARALRLEMTDADLELIERTESPTMLGGLPDYDELVKAETFKRRDWSPIVDRLMGRIESLERTRAELSKHVGDDDGEIESVQVVIERKSARVRDAGAE